MSTTSSIHQVVTKKHSAIQQQILSNYHKLMKLTAHAPDLRSQVRNEFKLHSHTIQRKNSIKIEYEIRRSEKYIELFETSGIKHKTNKQYITNVYTTNHDDNKDTNDTTNAHYVERGTFTKK